MLDPVRLVTDLFKEKNLSDTNLRAFAEGFLLRVAHADNNPGGIYNTLLVDTTNCYQNLYGSIVDQKVKAATSKGLTITVKNSFDAVILKLRGLQGLAKYKFGNGSAEYKEFFPRGMKQYHHVPLGNAENLFIRFRAIATMHLLADYPGEVAELNNLITAYVNAWHAKEGLNGKIDVTATGRHEHRKALTLQLTKSFLIIASNNVENPDKFDDYYEKRYLPIRKGKKKNKEEISE